MVCIIHQDIITAHLPQWFASCISMAQYCVTWLSALHPRLIGVHQASVCLIAVHQASTWLNAVHQVWNIIIAKCCASSINVGVLHASIWLNAVHGSNMCIRNQYCLMLCIRHQTGSILCIQASNWLDVDQASVGLNTVHQALLSHNIA